MQQTEEPYDPDWMEEIGVKMAVLGPSLPKNILSSCVEKIRASTPTIVRECAWRLLSESYSKNLDIGEDLIARDKGAVRPLLDRENEMKLAMLELSLSKTALSGVLRRPIPRHPHSADGSSESHRRTHAMAMSQ